MKKSLVFGSLIVTGLAFVTLSSGLARKATAEVFDTDCYRMNTLDTPIATEKEIQRADVWCYKQVTEPRGATLIYHIDSHGETRPELSILVQRDGTVVHASLKKGEISIHRLRSTFNPLRVPLTPPDGAVRVPTPITPSSVGSTDAMVKLFSEESAPLENIAINGPGEFKVSVAAEFMPWRGYWFPHASGRLHNGPFSPLAKFDRYVEGRTGFDPQAQAWEKANHDFHGTKWSGHCNGWAAASILRSEPKGPWTDPFTNVTFTVSDQKALFIERDYCPNLLFFGHRNREEESPGAGDIDAAEFHQVITYYVGQLGKPILMDKMSTTPVENRVVSAYDMKVSEVSANLYDIEMVLRVHEYDTKLTDEVGVAPSEERTYRYRLQTDPVGHIIKGQWHSSNPDFLWVPLSYSQCDSQNPAITEHWVETVGREMDLPGIW